MTFDDAGHDGFIRGINDPRMFGLEAREISRLAHGDNAISGNGERPGARAGVVHGQDVGVGDENVG